MSNESALMRKYRELWQQLIELRSRTGGHYSSEVMGIVDRMDGTWRDLSEEEQDTIYDEGEKVSEAPMEEAE